MDTSTGHTGLDGRALKKLVKRGLIRELFRRGQITQAQFEELMRLQGE